MEYGFDKDGGLSRSPGGTKIGFVLGFSYMV